MNIEIRSFEKVEISCNKEFSVFRIVDGEPVYIGPRSSTERVFEVQAGYLGDDTITLVVETDPDAVLSTNVRQSTAQELHDPTPVELGPPPKPETIQDIIKRYIREHVQEDWEPESPDEFFDFDLDEEDYALYAEHAEGISEETLAEEETPSMETSSSGAGQAPVAEGNDKPGKPVE